MWPTFSLGSARISMHVCHSGRPQSQPSIESHSLVGRPPLAAAISCCRVLHLGLRLAVAGALTLAVCSRRLVEQAATSCAKPPTRAHCPAAGDAMPPTQRPLPAGMHQRPGSLFSHVENRCLSWPKKQRPSLLLVFARMPVCTLHLLNPQNCEKQKQHPITRA